MGILEKRPLLTACAIFLALSLLGVQLSCAQRLFGILLLVICLLPLSVCAICLTGLRRLCGTLLLCILFGIGALLGSHQLFDLTLKPLEAQSEPASLVATVKKVNYAADYITVCTAKVTQFDTAEAAFTAELTFDGAAELAVGDILTATVLCTPFETDIYGYNERDSKLSHGVLLNCAVTEYSVSGMAELSHMEKLRAGIAARIDRAFKTDAAAMLKALLIGDQDGLDNHVVRDFRRLGISHILSISGTHFSILLGFVAMLLQLLHLNKKQIYLLLIPTALLYMSLSGFSASVCRSGIMALFSYLAFLFGRTRDAQTALFMSVTILIAIHPYAVLDIGLWLSFAATFSILVLSELFAVQKVHVGRLGWLFGLLRDLLLRAAITVAVFFGSLPITAFAFGEFSVIAPLANLLIVPLYEFLLYLIPFAVIGVNCRPIVMVTERYCHWIGEIAHTLADHDDLLLSLRQPLILPIAVCGLVAALVMLVLKLKHRLLVLVPVFLTLTAIAVYIPSFNAAFSATDRIVFLSEAKNEGFLLASDGETLYIDISTGASAPTRRAEQLAEELYDPELDGYMPTHYHQLHINTFNKLIARTHIKRLYLPPTVRDSDYDVRCALAATAERNGIAVVEMEYDIPIRFASCKVSLTAPQMLSRSTHPVICLSVTSGEEEVLYLGSSFADTALDADHMMRNASLVVFGQHAPLTKHAFTVKNDTVLLFVGETVAALADFPGEALYLRENSHFTYCFGGG